MFIFIRTHARVRNGPNSYLKCCIISFTSQYIQSKMCHLLRLFLILVLYKYIPQMWTCLKGHELKKYTQKTYYSSAKYNLIVSSLSCPPAILHAPMTFNPLHFTHTMMPRHMHIRISNQSQQALTRVLGVRAVRKSSEKRNPQEDWDIATDGRPPVSHYLFQVHGAICH